jgi:hypothetical protein
MSDIETKDKKSKTKTIKPKVDKYNGFKMPKGIPSIKWTKAIYTIIEEAKPELLKNEEVKKAFNNLVECLIKHDNIFIVSPINSKSKYNCEKYIKLSKDWKGRIALPGYFESRTDGGKRIEYNEERKEIADTYNILYELIKRDIVNYMEIKFHEQNKIKDTEYYNKIIELYHNNIKGYKLKITDLEINIRNIEEKIAEYANKALKGSIPTLTTFD